MLKPEIGDFATRRRTARNAVNEKGRKGCFWSNYQSRQDTLAPPFYIKTLITMEESRMTRSLMGTRLSYIWSWTFDERWSIVVYEPCGS